MTSDLKYDENMLISKIVPFTSCDLLFDRSIPKFDIPANMIHRELNNCNYKEMKFQTIRIVTNR